MSGTMLFVHGTGVRADGYNATRRVIREQAARHGLPLDVQGCYWGEAEGARLRVGGASIPGYAEAGGAAPSEADELLALWSVLYTDPWYELRLLRHRPRAGEVMVGPPPSVLFQRAVESFTPTPELQASLAGAGLAGYFDAALAGLRDAPELAEAAQTAPEDPLEHRGAVARALIAAALVAAMDDGHPGLDGETRDALVLTLTSELHGYGLGVGEFLLRPVKGIAARLITRKLTGDRGAITDATAPAAGDVLRFLAHGGGARDFVAAAIKDHGPGPVYLLAHSLGGIICADLLVRGPVPGVAGLITVGSQTPFLYEIGAFPALSHPDPLPEHMPRWLNVYDRRDLLAYKGDGVFPKHAVDRPQIPSVRDVAVDNGQPFPQSHSAYWTNPAFWAAVAAFTA